MRSLPIGVLGCIVAGEELGRFVEVLDDSANTGGYLIITYAGNDRSPEVFDAWLPTIVEVDLYFEEMGWSVDWHEDAG